MPKNIAITGASSEIGRAIFAKIVEPEDHIVLQCHQNADNCIELQKNHTGPFDLIIADFRDPESVERFCKNLPELDILVNAAGSTITGLLPNYSSEDILTMLNVNVLAPIKICKSVLPAMIVRRKGCIVNITSIAATRGNKGQTVYAGTKGFIESFTRALTAEFGSRGIRINCVAPGPIESGSLKELMSYAADEVHSSVVSSRLGRPEDVAALVGFLCSDQAEFINGKCLQVDGGFMRGI